MADLFADAADWLGKQLAAAGATRQITIHDPHDAGLTVVVEATPGESSFDEETTDGVVLRTVTRDWIVQTDQLDDQLGSVRPNRGWIITDSLDGSTWLVFTPGESPWRYCDTGRRRIRIHTQGRERQT